MEFAVISQYFCFLYSFALDRTPSPMSISQVEEAESIVLFMALWECFLYFTTENEVYCNFLVEIFIQIKISHHSDTTEFYKCSYWNLPNTFYYVLKR